MSRKQPKPSNKGLTFDKPTLDEISKSKFHEIAAKNWYQVKHINTGAKATTITKVYTILSEIAQANSPADSKVISDNLLKHLLILDHLKYLEKYVTFKIILLLIYHCY